MENRWQCQRTVQRRNVDFPLLATLAPLLGETGEASVAVNRRTYGQLSLVSRTLEPAATLQRNLPVQCLVPSVVTTKLVYAEGLGGGGPGSGLRPRTLQAGKARQKSRFHQVRRFFRWRD